MHPILRCSADSLIKEEKKKERNIKNTLSLRYSKWNSVSLLKISKSLCPLLPSVSLTKRAGRERETGRAVFSPLSIALIVVFPQRIIPLQLGELLVPDVATFTAYNCREDAALRSAQLFGDKCPPKREAFLRTPLSLSPSSPPPWIVKIIRKQRKVSTFHFLSLLPLFSVL